MPSPSAITIRPMGTADIPAVTKMLGHAFYQGGEMRYSFPDATEEEVGRFLGSTVRGYYFGNNNNAVRIDVTDDCQALALWIPPGGASMSMTGLCGLFGNMLRMMHLCDCWRPNQCYNGWNQSFPRQGLFHQVSEGMKPTEPRDYWYLALLATDPEAQGKGYGSALLQHGLQEHVDKSNYPVYLDCGYQNSKYYERKGDFQVIDVLPVNADADEYPADFHERGPAAIASQFSPKGVPYLFGMWRTANVQHSGTRIIQGNRISLQNDLPGTKNKQE